MSTRWLVERPTKVGGTTLECCGWDSMKILPDGTLAFSNGFLEPVGYFIAAGQWTTVTRDEAAE